MQEKTSVVAAQDCGCYSDGDESTTEYTVEKRGGVLNVTVTSGIHKGEQSVFFEMPPHLAYFNE